MGDLPGHPFRGNQFAGGEQSLTVETKARETSLRDLHYEYMNGGGKTEAASPAIKQVAKDFGGYRADTHDYEFPSPDKAAAFQERVIDELGIPSMRSHRVVTFNG